jgi:hypothetical protein
MKLNGKEISTLELENLFYTSNPDDLKKVRDALDGEFSDIEDGDSMMRSNIADNLQEAKRFLEGRVGCYGFIVRALEMAEAALDYYENLYFEELRLADEKRVSEANKNITDAKKEVKKLTDSVIKAQAAIKAGYYRRFRNYLSGYVRVCERSISALGTIVTACDHEANRASKMNYKELERSEATIKPTDGDSYE